MNSKEKTDVWFKVFNALSPYMTSQGECETATNDVMKALIGELK